MPLKTGLEIAKMILNWVLVRFSGRRQKASDAIRDSLSIDQVCQDIVQKGLSVDCFFLMMAHNGGGKFIPHGFKYRSVIGGYYTEWLMPNFKYNNYQNVIIDNEYGQLLNKLFYDKEIQLDTFKLDKGALKTKLTFEKIKFSRMFFLTENKTAMWYCVVGTTAHDDKLDSISQQYYIDVTVNKIKNIIKKY